MQIIKLTPDTVVELKKPHPCGSCFFRVARVGSEMRVICQGCGRDLTINRMKLEKQTKKAFSEKEAEGETV